MHWLRLRPTFEISVTHARDEVIERLSQVYRDVRSQNMASQEGEFLMHGEYGELHLPKDAHRVWSPHLSFYVTLLDNETLIRGRFAPRLEVWTGVWVVYLAMAFTVFFGLALGYSQWQLGESAWGVWIALLGIVLIVALYVVAAAGQSWSQDQMQLLRARLEEILRKARVDT